MATEVAGGTYHSFVLALTARYPAICAGGGRQAVGPVGSSAVPQIGFLAAS